MVELPQAWTFPGLNLHFPRTPPGGVARIQDEAVRKGWLRRQTAESRPIKDTTLSRSSGRRAFAKVRAKCLDRKGFTPKKGGSRPPGTTRSAGERSLGKTTFRV